MDHMIAIDAELLECNRQLRTLGSVAQVSLLTSLKKSVYDASEEQLSDILTQNDQVITFAQQCFFDTIRQAMSFNISKDDITYNMKVWYVDEKQFDKLATPEQVKKIPTKLVVKKPGFSDADAVLLYGFITADMTLSDRVKRILGSRINQMMGSIYYLMFHKDFLVGSFDKELKLQNKLVNFFEEAFNAILTYHEIRELIPKMPENVFVMIDCLVYGSKANHSSLYRRNMLNLVYVREKMETLDLHLIRGDDLYNLNYVEDSDTQVIAKGSSYYNVRDNSDFALTMKMFKRKYIAGPSGSCILLNTLVFDFLGYPETHLNKAQLLGWVIADYIPYFHTLTEILMSYCYEMDPSMGRRYNLCVDPVKYSVDLLKGAGIKIPDTVD
jgi:hypothetical protein